MRKFSFHLTILTLAAGIVGAVLRHFELATAFEADSGLAKPWATMTIVMALFVLLFAAALFFAARRLDGLSAPEGYEKAFGFSSGAKFGGQIVSSLVLIAAAILCLFTSKENGVVKAEIVIVGFLALISGICLIVLSSAAYRREDRGGLAFCSLAPVVFFCFLLTVLYKNRAADPVVLDYVYELFAACSVLLALFFSAGSACGRTRPKRTVFFCQLGVFFSIVTLADGHALWMTGICLFSALFLSLTGYSFVKNLEKPSPETADGGPKDPSEE